MAQRFEKVNFVFPAYAGMILQITATTTNDTSVPRIRGDDPEMTQQTNPVTMCSPHTRG